MAETNGHTNKIEHVTDTFHYIHVCFLENELSVGSLAIDGSFEMLKILRLIIGTTDNAGEAASK